MDVQKIVSRIKSNDPETSRMAIESIYACYKTLSEKDVQEVTPAVVYYLWKLPKFTAQKQFVLELLSHTDQRLRHEILMHIVRTWEEIQLTRMDKFYYLVKRLLEHYVLDVETVSHLFNITPAVSLRAFIIRCVVDRLEEVSEEMERFLAEFASRCPPALLFSLGKLRLAKGVVLKYAGDKDVGKRNRAALYSMIK